MEPAGAATQTAALAANSIESWNSNNLRTTVSDTSASPVTDAHTIVLVQQH